MMEGPSAGVVAMGGATQQRSCQRDGGGRRWSAARQRTAERDIVSRPPAAFRRSWPVSPRDLRAVRRWHPLR